MLIKEANGANNTNTGMRRYAQTVLLPSFDFSFKNLSNGKSIGLPMRKPKMTLQVL